MSIDAASAPLVAISILNWNGWEDTLECLESVRKLDYPNYLTVVVDNGSWNGSADKIKAWAEANLGPGHVIADYSRETALVGGDPKKEQALDSPASPDRLVLIRNEGNLGLAGGQNVSISYGLARRRAARYFFLLNSDCVVLDTSTLSSVVSVSQRRAAGVVGAITTPMRDPQQKPEGPYSYYSLPTSLFDPVARPVTVRQLEPDCWRSDAVCGGAMLVASEVFCSIYGKRAEYFPTRLFYGWDDQLFCYTARRLGFSIVGARHTLVYHPGGKSYGGYQSPLPFYYRERNKILLTNMALPFGWRILFHAVNPVFALGRIIKYYLRRQPVLARAAISGVVDGYRGVGGKWREHDRLGVARGD